MSKPNYVINEAVETASLSFILSNTAANGKFMYAKLFLETMAASHSKKEKVTLILLRLSQLQLNDTMHVTPTLSFYFSYTLETDSMCAMCGCLQSVTRVMFAMMGT